MSRLTRLHLRGYRCWRELEWSPQGDVHLLVGDNGVGKTSVLEAIAIAAQLRPPHGLRWRELIPQGEEAGFLAATLVGALGEQQVRVGFDRQERRLKVDEQSPRSAAAFASQHPVVFFRPGDLSLVQGGPKGRRRLLDGIAERLCPEHRDLQARYAQALAARNALLRPRAGGGDLLDLWSHEAARYGAELMRWRQRASEALSEHLQPAYAALCAESEKLTARYRPAVWGDDLVAELLKLWTSNLARDQRQGHTSAGPHSEDWELRLEGRSLRQRASQGQQRSAVLACRLAQVELVATQNQAPILLLDDIAGELDDQRAERLFSRLLGRAGQVFVSATRDPGAVLGSDREMHRFHVKSGELMRIG